uniref:Uncharacterized protein n=1 Tax=Eutreptiella gymnastica TaxID=73025 RepID=A0A7S1JEZ1_9EUGL|mmetsp:Transcript_90949/g.157781  ORF Transcript_90949/g.157781 Transcript_90949/m.157781 type:complete len:183 (+) Transcript_90949:20-568(+)
MLSLACHQLRCQPRFARLLVPAFKHVLGPAPPKGWKPKNNHLQKESDGSLILAAEKDGRERFAPVPHMVDDTISQIQAIQDWYQMQQFLDENISKLKLVHAGALWNRSRAITQLCKARESAIDQHAKSLVLLTVYLYFGGRKKVKEMARKLAPREIYNRPNTLSARAQRRLTLEAGRHHYKR